MDERKVVYIESDSHDPAFNLALEQYVFDNMPKDQDYFWLWQNDNAIIVGRYQNTAQEINQKYVNEKGIRVVRRLSGGGTVYHDMGNVNFTFIADAGNLEQLNLQKFCLPVVETLKKIGVEADLSGRNDISIDGKKFSGNSQYIKKGRIMHHGTLMFDSDLSQVAASLQVTEAKYKSKGFGSVRSRVTNIKPYAAAGMTMEDFQSILKENMMSGDTEVYHLTDADLAEIFRIKAERYDTWEWNYGISPDYSVSKKVRVEGCGQLEFCMDVSEGTLRSLAVFGDYFGEGVTEELWDRLRDCPLREEILLDRLDGFDMGFCFLGLKTEQFVSIMLNA